MRLKKDSNGVKIGDNPPWELFYALRL